MLQYFCLNASKGNALLLVPICPNKTLITREIVHKLNNKYADIYVEQLVQGLKRLQRQRQSDSDIY